MCGISGYIVNNNAYSSSIIQKMSNSISHRGPDDEGFALINTSSGEIRKLSSKRSPAILKDLYEDIDKISVEHNIAFAHNRYSILDLSVNGHQPMWSECNNYSLIFNGEIYNFIEIREELKLVGYIFKTSTDTEVLLNACIHFGDSVLNKLNGFFAFVFFDKNKKSTLIARDRVGVANLYLINSPGEYVFFASEIKALLQSEKLDINDLNKSSIFDFLYFGKRDRAGTFWNKVIDFPPAHYCWIDNKCIFEPRRYWSTPNVRHNKNDYSLNTAKTEFLELLTNSLELRLRSDIPVAFELSGGLDSSTLVGLTCGLLNKKIHTCTVEFQEKQWNEEPYARKVFEMYKNNITYTVEKPIDSDFWDNISEFILLEEEPFLSPNLKTNQLIRKKFKEAGFGVVITGAAGDELLAGYAGEYQGAFLNHLIKNRSFDSFFTEILKSNEISITSSLTRMFANAFFSDNKKIEYQNKLQKNDIYHSLLLDEYIDIKGRFKYYPDSVSYTFSERVKANMTHRFMNYWLRSSVKSDYGIPIETRAPFLDYKFIEYSMKLPPEYLIKNGYNKYIIRESMNNLLPKEILMRKIKLGFPFPLKSWLYNSKNRIISEIYNLEIDLINVDKLISNFDNLNEHNPSLLWRYVSVCLWYKYVVKR